MLGGQPNTGVECSNLLEIFGTGFEPPPRSRTWLKASRVKRTPWLAERRLLGASDGQNCAAPGGTFSDRSARADSPDPAKNSFNLNDLSWPRRLSRPFIGCPGKIDKAQSCAHFGHSSGARNEQAQGIRVVGRRLACRKQNCCRRAHVMARIDMMRGAQSARRAGVKHVARKDTRWGKRKLKREV